MPSNNASGSIRLCDPQREFDVIYEIINDAACAYRGVIPKECWKEPYMSKEELRQEIKDGVQFWGYEAGGRLTGVMGLQDVAEVTLIRHAYVRTDCRHKGVGSALLSYLRARTQRPLLIGTWQDATWAVRFYEKHGFSSVQPVEKDRLLKRYWTVPQRQISASVVLRENDNDKGRRPF